MTLPQGDEQQERRRILTIAIVIIIAQVGVLTLAIILGALFGGLWLDNHFQTKPVFTMVLLVASIPVSLLMMLWVVRKGLARVQFDTLNRKKREEDANLGKDS